MQAGYLYLPACDLQEKPRWAPVLEVLPRDWTAPEPGHFQLKGHNLSSLSSNISPWPAADRAGESYGERQREEKECCKQTCSHEKTEMSSNEDKLNAK